MADLNGDRRPDLISGSYVPGDVYWFRAGSGGFQRGKKIAEAPPKTIERAASAASFADWDGDGDLDMLVGNINGEVHWIRNEGTRRQFKFGARRALLAGGKPLRVPRGDAHPIAADWDGDGVLDLLVGCGDGSVQFCKGVRKSTSGTPILWANVPLMAGGKPIALESRTKLFVHDWNEDGHLDLLAGNFDSKGNRQYVGNVYIMLRQP